MNKVSTLEFSDREALRYRCALISLIRACERLADLRTHRQICEPLFAELNKSERYLDDEFDEAEDLTEAGRILSQFYGYEQSPESLTAAARRLETELDASKLVAEQYADELKTLMGEMFFSRPDGAKGYFSRLADLVCNCSDGTTDDEAFLKLCDLLSAPHSAKTDARRKFFSSRAEDPNTGLAMLIPAAIESDLMMRNQYILSDLLDAPMLQKASP